MQRLFSGCFKIYPSSGIRVYYPTCFATPFLNYNTTVANPGEGAEELAPLLFLDQTKARRAEKGFLGATAPPPPLSQGLDDPPPHLKVWTRNCTRYAINQNLYKPRVRTNIDKQMISLKAIDLWASIPRYLEELNEYAQFKKKKITHHLLIEQYLSRPSTS